MGGGQLGMQGRAIHSLATGIPGGPYGSRVSVSPVIAAARGLLASEALRQGWSVFAEASNDSPDKAPTDKT